MLSLDSVVTPRTIQTRLGATARFPAIEELLGLLVHSNDLSMRRFGKARDAVFRTERIQPSGTSCGVAIPYGILDGLVSPVAAIGVSEEGIDFGAGALARVVILLLYPPGTYTQDHGLFPALAGLTDSAESVEQLLEADTSVEFERRLKALDQQLSARH